MSRHEAALVLALVALVPGPLAAGENPASGGFEREARESLGGSMNPLGLQNVFEVTWKRPHLSLGVASRVTPAYARLGGWVQISPLPVLDLRAGVEPVGYFGTFKSLLSFESYDSPFDDDTRKARADEAGAATAGRLYLAPTVKAKAGPVVARVRADFEWWKAWTDGPFFYEPMRDTLLEARGDAMVTSEAVLLYEFRGSGGRKLLLGPVHDMTWVYAARKNRRQDVGLLGIWSLGGRKLGLREPTVYAKVVYYVEDPFRCHEIGAQLAFGGALGRARR